jgi:hypothetical protein
VPLLGAFPVRTLLQGEGGAGSTSAGVSVGKELGTLEWAGASGAAPTQRGALCGAVGGFRREGELHRNLASWEQVDRTGLLYYALSLCRPMFRRVLICFAGLHL